MKNNTTDKKFNLANERSESLKKGKKAEVIVFNSLKDNGFEIKDVTDSRLYQSNEIDFVLLHNKKNYGIEVKTDYKIAQTKNFFCEYTMLKDGGIKGWMDKCKADYLIWYNFELNTMWILYFDKLKEVVDKRPQKKIWNNCEQCFTMGVLISIEECIEHGILKESNIHENVA